MYGRCCYILFLIYLEVISDVAHENLPPSSEKAHSCHPGLLGTKLEKYSRFPREGKEQRMQNFAVPKDSDFKSVASTCLAAIIHIQHSEQLELELWRNCIFSAMSLKSTVPLNPCAQMLRVQLIAGTKAQSRSGCKFASNCPVLHSLRPQIFYQLQWDFCLVRITGFRLLA